MGIRHAKRHDAGDKRDHTFTHYPHILYVSDNTGHDTDGSGVEDYPFKTTAQAFTYAAGQGWATVGIMLDTESTSYALVSIPDNLIVSITGLGEALYTSGGGIAKLEVGQDSLTRLNNLTILHIKEATTVTSNCDVQLEECLVGDLSDFAETGPPTFMDILGLDTLIDNVAILPRLRGAKSWIGQFYDVNTDTMHFPGSGGVGLEGNTIADVSSVEGPADSDCGIEAGTGFDTYSKMGDNAGSNAHEFRDSDDAVVAKVDSDGKGTFEGADMGSEKVENVLDPTVNQDAATKAYVDSQVGGKDEFVELDDTPSSYTGQADKWVKVETGGSPDELVFIDHDKALHDALNIDADTLDSLDSSDFIQKDGSVAFTGDQSMGNNKLTSVTTPSADGDAATKGYVDGVVTGHRLPVKVLNMISDTDQGGSPPGAPSEGDAYVVNNWGGAHNDGDIKEYDGAAWQIIVANVAAEPPDGVRVVVKKTGGAGSFTGQGNEIGTYATSGSSWSFTTANDGDAAVVSGDGSVYEGQVFVYDSNLDVWASTGSATAHNSTSNKQGGTTDEYYHVTSAENVEVGRLQPDVSLAGVTPVDADVSGWSDGDKGHGIGTGSREFYMVRRSGSVKYVEMS